jgi:hypothetical protein
MRENHPNIIQTNKPTTTTIKSTNKLNAKMMNGKILNKTKIYSDVNTYQPIKPIRQTIKPDEPTKERKLQVTEN